jgi:hypothetical protein
VAERHGLADFLEVELPKLHAEWEQGSIRALIEAFMWCAGNGYPFPDWLLDTVQDELLYSMAHRPRGGTKLATALARDQAASDHKIRFLMVDQFLRFQQEDFAAGRRLKPPSEIEAAKDAQTLLASNKHRAANASPETIRRSWKRLRPI